VDAAAGTGAPAAIAPVAAVPGDPAVLRGSRGVPVSVRRPYFLADSSMNERIDFAHLPIVAGGPRVFT
jgi:hypothetical protein